MLAAVILLIATNAGLIGVSRLTYSMGQHRQLPEGLRQVHPKYRTPYIAIMIFAGVAIITLLPGKTDFLATMYSFGAMLSFTIAHVAVIQLRRSQPEAERTWKPPLNVRAFGFERAADRGARRPRHLRRLGRGDGAEPAHAVRRDRLDGRSGSLVYVLYRRNQGLPLTETVKVVTAGAARGRGGRVPLDPGRLRGRRRLLAGDGRDRGQTRLQAAPRHPRPLDDDRADQPAARAPRCPRPKPRRSSKIEEARLIGGQRVTGHVARVRPGQSGYSVADEAEQIKAAVIVIGLRYRRGVPLYDKMLQTVLGERPCRVIVVSDPVDKRAPVPDRSAGRGRPL